MGEEERKVENVIIVGSGPAGFTAALYTARADLEPLVIEGFAWGGQLQQTTDVENYPGYPEGVTGPEMMQEFRDQAERFGTRFITDDATAIELSDGGIHKVVVGREEHFARAVILAMGAEARKLGVPGEEELSSRGVSYCATCDAAFFRDKPTIVVGGGDTAMEDATFLAKFAKDVKVIHRRNEFRASKIMLGRAEGMDNIELLTPYTVDRFEADDDGALARAVLAPSDDGAEERTIDIEGAFIAIGHTPQSELVKDQLETDDEGYIIVDSPSTRTKLAGVFAAGDLVDHTYRQAVTAAGTGCAAALDAEAYLRDTPPDPEAHWAGEAEKDDAEAESAVAK